MDAYNVPDQGLADVYLIQSTESNPEVAAQLKQFGAMYNEGVPDYFVDQNLYFPTATSYGYICTGYEPITDWEERHRNFGLDGQDIQFTGAANESLPYVYYSPSYGYGQSPYNPYNPYIPGAMIGLDGSIVAPQQYYALPSYENSVSSPAYLPMVLQLPDAIANGMTDSVIDKAVPVNKMGGLAAKRNLPSNTSNSSLTAIRDASNRRNSFARVSEGDQANTETGKKPVPNITSGTFGNQGSTQISRVRGPQGTENGVHGKASSGSSLMKSVFMSSNGLSGFEASDHAREHVHKVKPKVLYGRGPTDVRGTPDTLNEQNWGPGTKKTKNQLIVKAYTARAGNVDAQGNIIIYTDQYNKVDFPVDYRNARFFVIKSYSEDDVHKSIKYNVWSSTPNGNKKLNAAYEDAQRIAAGDPSGCPIFLFFSVNASGQFCGVAEMTGPVDFHKDMDFWQQDKWSGSFPVKWHIIKDLPNPNFRHIILENNENKPVTNSRDTQEICHRKGLEMLQIFKNHTLKTSLLDDFMYYENRQRILQEERARLLIKSYGNPFLAPLVDPPRKLQSIHDFPSIGDVNVAKVDAGNSTIAKKSRASADGESDRSSPTGQVPLDSTANNLTNVGESQGNEVSVQNAVDELKIESLTIQSDEPTASVSNTTKSEPVNVVTIGSMPVKVMGNEESGFLTVGTIPLDPRALQRD